MQGLTPSTHTLGEVMKFLGMGADHRQGWVNYMAYLQTIRSRLPPGVYDFASNSMYYDLSNHHSLHDAWLENLEVKEIDGTTHSQDRTIRIMARFFGAFHDGHMYLTYENVSSYSLNMAGLSDVGNRAHGDCFSHEVRLSESERVLHEIQFSGGGIWVVECTDFTYSSDIQS
jgi:hypothetical protein